MQAPGSRARQFESGIIAEEMLAWLSSPEKPPTSANYALCAGLISRISVISVHLSRRAGISGKVLGKNLGTAAHLLPHQWTAAVAKSQG